MNRQELHAKVQRVVHDLLQEKGVVTPLDVFLQLEKITPKQVEEWRFGRVSYLERVLNGSLSQLSSIMSSLRQIAQESQLRPSFTSYMRWGKGPKQPLRFSKSGNANIETLYATHYLPGSKKKDIPSEKGEKIEIMET